jgi:hypothetical protein
MLSKRSRFFARCAPMVPHAVLVVAGLLASGCSAGLDAEEADGPPDFRGNPSGTGGSSQGAAPIAPANVPTSPAATGVVPAANGTEQNPANGAPLSPNTNVNAGNANAAAGAGGVGNVSAAGGAPGSATGNAGSPPVPPSAAGGAPPVTPVTPAAPDIPCPAGAFFCSGFEGADFPAGTRNIIGGSTFADAFALDTAEVHSGQQSFFLPKTSQAFSYRVMAIPVPVQAFYARIFVRFDSLFGDVDHDGLFAISSGDLQVDNNNETRIEFAEQEGTIVLNRSTDVIGFPLVRPTTLPPNVWHCIETRFDGAAGDIEVSANGQSIIREVGLDKYRFTVQTFRIGTLQFHAPRAVWFDDVVLSPNPIGCN